MTNIRKKIEQQLEVKEYYEHDNRVYFKTLSGYIVSLPKTRYFERKRELTEYFNDRPEAEKNHLVLENLSLLAVPLPTKDYQKPKIEVFRHTCWATTIKVSDYDENDPQWGDDKDIMLKKSLTDARGNVLSEIEQESWNSASERTSWVTDFAIKIRDKLREGLR
jgi:hypothetical protein